MRRDPIDTDLRIAELSDAAFDEIGRARDPRLKAYPDGATDAERIGWHLHFTDQDCPTLDKPAVARGWWAREIAVLRIGPCGDLQAFTDGELDSEAAQEFRDHLPGCVPCQTKLLDTMQVQVRLEDAAPTPDVEVETDHIDGIDQSDPVHENEELTQTIGNVEPVSGPDETQPMERGEVDGRVDEQFDDSNNE